MSSVQSDSANSITERWMQRSSNLLTIVWFAGICAAIIWGWLNRNEGWLVAESGLGYALGIIGSILMLLLLTYSLRKRWQLMRRFLSVRFWFRLHMIFGIIGPLAILFHSNFRLASLNSTVSMMCMLLVAGSGLIGRYLYTHIHYGLYGEKIRISDILKDFSSVEADILKLAVLDKQQAMATKLFAASRQLVEEQRYSVSMLASIRSARRARKIAINMQKLTQHLSAYYRKRARSPQQLTIIQQKLYEDNAILLIALKKIPRLQLFERLFSLWHVVHIPIFILMIISVLVHILVVHMY